MTIKQTSKLNSKLNAYQKSMTIEDKEAGFVFSEFSLKIMTGNIIGNGSKKLSLLTYVKSEMEVRIIAWSDKVVTFSVTAQDEGSNHYVGTLG